jgi:hypothetical protein
MLGTTNSYQFPRIDQPESKKNLDYYTQWSRAICANTITDNWADNYTTMAELYKFYTAGSSGDLTSFLQSNPDGSSLPAYWITVNTIKTKLRLLLGELEERGYEIRVNGVNGEIVSRKMDEKERLRVQRRLAPVRRQAEQISGMPLQDQEQYIPQTEQELDEYMDLSYKDKSELIMEAALKFLAQWNNWDENRKQLWLDTMIVHRAITEDKIVNGLPISERVDPMMMVIDPNCKDDMCSDATMFARIEYMPRAQAAQRYGLTDKELDDCYSNYQIWSGIGNIAGATLDASIRDGFGSISPRFKWFQDNGLRVMVVRAVWRDIKYLNHKDEVKEKDGVPVEFFQKVKDTEVKENTVVTKLECWRQATIIGGMIVKDWGECPNQPRDLSRLQKSEPPFRVWIPDLLQGRTVSPTEQLVGLQLYKDILLYNLQLQVSSSGGKILVYDLSMLPEGMTQNQMMSFVKGSRIAFVNSKEYQLTQGNMNLFKEIDMSLTSSINSYAQMIAMVDQQMDAISGVSPERQGIVQGSSQAVGVTTSALFQSNLITAPYFKGFERFCSRVLNYQAKLVKIAFPAAPEKFAPIIGEVGIDFLKNGIDIELDEFAVFVRSLPPIVRDRALLDQKLDLYLQSAQGDPQALVDVLAIQLEPDTKQAVRRFTRKVALRTIMMQQQQKELDQRDAELQQQMQEVENQRLMATQEHETNLQGMKDSTNIKKTLITGRVKTNDKKLSLLEKSFPK